MHGDKGHAKRALCNDIDYYVFCAKIVYTTGSILCETNGRARRAAFVCGKCRACHDKCDYDSAGAASKVVTIRMLEAFLEGCRGHGTDGVTVIVKVVKVVIPRYLVGCGDDGPLPQTFLLL
jgi:hypothetical protein